MNQANRHLRLFFWLFISLPLSACLDANLKKDGGRTEFDFIETDKLAEAAYQSNDWVESEKHYAVLVQEVPQRALYWFRLGNVYARTNRPDAAIIAYREAVLRDPEMTKGWFNMGVLQLKQAANSFNELRLYGDRSSPLHSRGNDIFVGILDMMQGEEESEEHVDPDLSP